MLRTQKHIRLHRGILNNKEQYDNFHQHKRAKKLSNEREAGADRVENSKNKSKERAATLKAQALEPAAFPLRGRNFKAPDRWACITVASAAAREGDGMMCPMGPRASRASSLKCANQGPIRITQDTTYLVP